MGGDETAHLQILIDRLQRGDDSARQELIGHSYERLRLLARKMLHTDFPRLQNLHATGSVLDETALRLLSALKQVSLQTVAGFFGFAALQMRRVLMDMARRRSREGQRLNPHPANEDINPVDSGCDPAQLAIW